MRAAGLALALLAGMAGSAAAQEVALTAPRPGTAQPLQIWASYAEGGWSFRVTDEAGRERQRFIVQRDAPEATPWVGDASGDGAGDLFVPVTQGTANTAFAVWTMEPQRGQFRLAGEVSGLDFARDAGWLVARSRNGCCAVSLTFYSAQRGGAGLREAFGIERTLREDGSTARCVGTRGAPQDVVRPWCSAGDDWPPGVVRLR